MTVLLLSYILYILEALLIFTSSEQNATSNFGDNGWWRSNAGRDTFPLNSHPNLSKRRCIS